MNVLSTLTAASANSHGQELDFGLLVRMAESRRAKSDPPEPEGAVIEGREAVELS